MINDQVFDESSTLSLQNLRAKWRNLICRDSFRQTTSQKLDICLICQGRVLSAKKRPAGSHPYAVR